MRRVVFLSLVLNLVACSADPSGPEPESMRKRLATETHLFVEVGESAGVVTAQRRTDTGWAEGLVDLELGNGEIVVTRTGNGIMLGALALAFQPVEIPSSVVGHAATLTNVRLRLIAPTMLMPTWNDDDDAQATTNLDLTLSWVLTVDGTSLPLGAPSLPSLPVSVRLTGDGLRITGEIRLHVAGELWSWADLVRLKDFELVLSARTMAP